MPRKKKESTEIQSDVVENFLVVSSVQEKQEQEPAFSVEEETNRRLLQAMKTYDLAAKQSSAYFEEKGSYTSPTADELGQLAECPQDSLSKILRINSIISKYSNLDDVLGTVTEAIRVNLNDQFRLSFKNIDARNKAKKLERVKEAIDSFNEDIRLSSLIRDQIPRAYSEGTVIMYLRKSETGWCIDTFPIGIAQISPYSVSGDPVVLIDMTELKNRLNKIKYRSRSGKNLFFNLLDDEIKENFCDEIYQAYLNKDPYAKLDIRYTGVMRIGNAGKKYGVSPMLKAIPASMILEAFQKSDMTNAKARSKKMVYQLLDPVLLGPNGDKNPLQQQAFAHSEIIAAYSKQGSVLYTAPAYVTSVNILEPAGEMIDKDTVLYYMHKQMSALGIGFLTVEASASISSAKISLEQLMRNINSIGKSLEDIIVKFYRQMLIDEGHDPSLAPSIQILDSEALEMELRVKLVDVLYSKLNGSLRTAMETLGFDYEEELNRRTKENKDGADKTFYARENQYTKSGNSNAKDTGRPPAEEETDKNQYDENYNDQR